MKTCLLILLLALLGGSHASKCKYLLDMIAVLDGSDSITDANFVKLKNAMITLAHWLSLGDGSQRLGAVVYSTGVSEYVPLSSSINTIEQRIIKFKHPKMGTSTHDGIDKMRQLFLSSGRKGVPKVGVVITDGRSINPEATKKAAQQAKNLGIEMFAIGIGSLVNDTELQWIASNGNNVKHLANFDKLQSIIPSLVKEKCVDPCSGCRYENGVGYMPHKRDCRYFLQCINFGKSFFVKSCPRGLYWEQEHLTCTRSKKNCKIPVDDVVDVDDGTVVDADHCKEGNRRPVVGNSISFEEKSSAGWVQKQCAPGTVYDSKICLCAHGGPITNTGCKAALYLPFNTDLLDHSGHNVFVENIGVNRTLFGQGSFTRNSFLRVNRFSNMDFRETLIIDFLVNVVPSRRRSQALVSNADCEKEGSVYIILKSSYVQFKVLSKTGMTHILHVKLTTPRRGLTRVKLTIHGGTMTGQVNGHYSTRSFKDGIAKTHCALQIGKGTRLEGFRGLMDDFKLFLCKN